MLTLSSSCVFSVCVLQWVIDSGATSDWNIGSFPDARGLACLRRHGIDSDHRAQQVLQPHLCVCICVYQRCPRLKIFWSIVEKIKGNPGHIASNEIAQAATNSGRSRLHV